ncbi:barstar family protein [Gimesia fumaroli]|uniref:Barstar (Barnase inhibitor) n=1 Tax=Gimesia fumaroli TaxID=2527976 RepID=A0A518IL14_9PLAN|nr:barstar family protein [Gimesia fumaroli]QDV53783.1 Barstar (barnase inhibitor) [Gimesia fumaroli]
MNDNKLDFQILARGPVTKYFSLDLLEQHLQWFGQQEYKIYRFDAKTWYSTDNFYSDVHAGFEFPDYFGRNWDALHDCLFDMVSENENVLVVVRNFDDWYQENANSAKRFLDYMAIQTYQFLLAGKRWITLIQSNRPSFEVADVGAQSVYWNEKEWMNRDRGL